MGCKQSMTNSTGAMEAIGGNENMALYRVSETSRSFHAEYLLGSRLGKGAFAQVYEVRKVGPVNQAQPWAVKVMDLRADRSVRPLSEQEEVDTKRRSSVDKEIELLRAVRSLRHSVTMIDNFIEGCFSYVVMEKCDRTLLQHLESMPTMTEHTLRPIFSEMIESLAEIHRVEVIHRDLKPDNFLCWNGSPGVKLCDFGLAITAPPNVALSGVYGTPPFMAPEMLSSKGYNAKMDVWSVGVIMYVLLYGQFPYKPVEQNGKAMKAAIKAGIPAPSFRPKAGTGRDGIAISAEATSFLKDILSRSPENRPSAEEALRNRWLAGEVDDVDTKSAPSLRPMLYAARRAGAFDPPPPSASRASKSGEVVKSGIDMVMEELQAKHHRSSPSHLKHPGSPPSSASTDAGFSVGLSGATSGGVDFQAPGALS